MQKGVIPQIINQFNMYKGVDDGGEKMFGISGEITLPELSAMTETITGAGLLGEIEAKNPGHYTAGAIEIPFIGITEDMMSLDPTTYNLVTFRASEQSQVKTTRELVYSSMKVVIGGTVKDYKLGTVKIGSQMGSSVNLSWDYIKIEIDGAVVLELDKLNEVFIVNGEDKLAKIRDMC